MEAGVIDPTKVTRSALENAASIAGLLLTTEAVIAEKPEEKKAAAPRCMAAWAAAAWTACTRPIAPHVTDTWARSKDRAFFLL